MKIEMTNDAVSLDVKRCASLEHAQAGVQLQGPHELLAARLASVEVTPERLGLLVRELAVGERNQVITG
jgi:hypothetical protein